MDYANFLTIFSEIKFGTFTEAELPCLTEVDFYANPRKLDRPVSVRLASRETEFDVGCSSERPSE